ncbi:MAG TPA: hypothetical protein VHV75_15915 [Solirubrobacteraceae bacterium]|jgi:hypothetical protein|nr:hypothetical protein [Solirubrobacteraceae bacterium]
MTLTPPDSSPPVVRGASDLHGQLPAVEPCDVLFLAGDLVPLEVQEDDQRSKRWLSEVFARWLDEVPAAEVVGIAGNHDFALERLVGHGAHPWLFDAKCTYLRHARMRPHGMGHTMVARQPGLGVQF